MRPGDAIPAVDVERVLAATILTRDARLAVASAHAALHRTARYHDVARTVRDALTAADVGTVATALYDAGARLATDIEATDVDEPEALARLIVASESVRSAHRAVVAALVARALRRPS